MKKLCVTGATGVLGSAVVAKLREREDIRCLLTSRNPPLKNAHNLPWQRVNLETGEGLMASLNGVDTVLHLASNQTTIGHEPMEVVTIRNLLAAAQEAGVNHLIYISIVGVDRIPFSYYRAKLAVEKLIQESPLPYTILRATQFHSLIDHFINKLFSFPVGLVPGSLKAQPISVESVAARLLTIADGDPQQTVLNLGGKEVLNLRTMVDIWQRYQPRTKPVLPLPTVGKLMHAFTKGYNTCHEIAADSQSWEVYLRSRSK